MGRHVGSARNGIQGTSGGLKLVCNNEAVLSRGEGDLVPANYQIGNSHVLRTESLTRLAKMGIYPKISRTHSQHVVERKEKTPF